MATATLPEPTARLDYGRLANNYMLVQGVQRALSRSEMNVRSVPLQVSLLISEDAWREFLLEDGRVVRNPADFRRFIEADRPEGCQTPLHVLRHMVAGSEIADEVERLLRGTPGGLQHDGRDESGRFHNRNNVTVVDEPDPDIIPLPTPAARKRDYSRESQQGNSTGYALRRLEKEAPELLTLVKTGDMSVNTAAVRAGIRDKAITIPAVPRKAARILARHFRGVDLAELIDLLSSALSDEIDHDLNPGA